MAEARRVALALALTVSYALLPGCTTPDESTYAELHRAYTRTVDDHLTRAVTTAPDKRPPVANHLPPVPESYSPWWQQQLGAKVFESNDLEPCPLEDLYVRTLLHSGQIRVFSELPLIRETGIQEAEGRFDVRAFIDSKYESVNEPVGSLLTSEVEDVFRQKTFTTEGGLRWKSPLGGDLTLSQRATTTASNSEFLSPEPQSQARLTLSVVQPLLKGAGLRYNQSVLYVARLDSEVAQAEFIRQAESHLISVCSAYWGLYQARAEFLIRRKLVADTEKVLEHIKSRQDLDAAKVQLVRATSALASRKVSLVRTELSIRNAEDRLRALVNDDILRRSPTVELLPTTPLSFAAIELDPSVAAVTAIQHRPEITQGMNQLKSLAVREDIAKNELLPQVNLILEGSLRGLADEYNVRDSIDVEPERKNWLVGLSVEFPLGNNDATARYKRRRLEVRQQLQQMRTSVETILLEVKFAVREHATAYRELQGKYQALLSAQEDLRTLEERWGLNGNAGGQAGAAYLDLLLDAQGRVSFADEDFLRSATSYSVALMTVQRAQGKLLNYLDIHVDRRTGADELPEMFLRKGAASGSGGRSAAPAIPAGAPAGDAAAGAKEAATQDAAPKNEAAKEAAAKEAASGEGAKPGSPAGNPPAGSAPASKPEEKAPAPTDKGGADASGQNPNPK